VPDIVLTPSLPRTTVITRTVTTTTRAFCFNQLSTPSRAKQLHVYIINIQLQVKREYKPL